jgi:hypothetical protein
MFCAQTLSRDRFLSKASRIVEILIGVFDKKALDHEFVESASLAAVLFKTKHLGVGLNVLNLVAPLQQTPSSSMCLDAYDA